MHPFATLSNAAMPRLACALLACAFLACALAAPVARADEVERGRRLAERYACGACHRIPGLAAARGTLGPPLDGFGRRGYIAGRLPNGPALLARWIVDPPALVPGTAMPRLGVAPDEARDIAAYLLSLQP